MLLQLLKLKTGGLEIFSIIFFKTHWFVEADLTVVAGRVGGWEDGY